MEVEPPKEVPVELEIDSKTDINLHYLTIHNIQEVHVEVPRSIGSTLLQLKGDCLEVLRRVPIFGFASVELAKLKDKPLKVYGKISHHTKQDQVNKAIGELLSREAVLWYQSDDLLTPDIYLCHRKFVNQQL
jgi:hypothetical protein